MSKPSDNSGPGCGVCVMLVAAALTIWTVLRVYETDYRGAPRKVDKPLIAQEAVDQVVVD